MKRLLAILSILFVAPCLNAQPAPDGGTIIRPAHDVTVPLMIREKLSEAADIRAFASLPDGDSAVVYDTVRDKPDTADFMDNNPHFALFHNGELVFRHDSGAPVGPIRFHGMAIVPLRRNDPLMVFAFDLGVDGAATFFVFVENEPEGYRVVATLRGTQAQLRFHNDLTGQFEFWTADGQASRDPDKQCVWCLKVYKKTAYEWRNGELRQLVTSRERRAYEPEAFAQAPFLLKK